MMDAGFLILNNEKKRLFLRMFIYNLIKAYVDKIRKIEKVMEVKEREVLREQKERLPDVVGMAQKPFQLIRRQFPISPISSMQKTILPPQAKAQVSEKPKIEEMRPSIISSSHTMDMGGDRVPIPMHRVGRMPVSPKFTGPRKAYALEISDIEKRKRIEKIPPQPIFEGFGKIDSLIKNPEIRVIEAQANKNVKIKKGVHKEDTQIILNDQEIRDIIKIFSEKSRIPMTESTFIAEVGNLRMNAILSDIIGSRFIITKSSEEEISERGLKKLPQTIPKIEEKPKIKRDEGRLEDLEVPFPGQNIEGVPYPSL